MLAGESVDELAFLLGHKDANVTRAVYVHEVADARRRAMCRQRIEAEFGPLLRGRDAEGAPPPGRRKAWPQGVSRLSLVLVVQDGWSKELQSSPSENLSLDLVEGREVVHQR